MKTTCPSCGAELVFKASFSVFAVCAYCGSTVVRQDKDVELVGAMADLPDEMTPLQVGTELTYKDQPFTIVGRVRVGWEDGAWNEWYLAGAEGDPAWLAEAQGSFAVSTPAPLEQVTGLTPTPQLFDVVQFEGRSYRVADIKEATVIGSEGELPFRAPKGRTATYYDMVEVTGGFASLEQSAEGRSFYVGSYVPFDALRFQNLRDVEGWAKPVASKMPVDQAAEI